MNQLEKEVVTLNQEEVILAQKINDIVGEISIDRQNGQDIERKIITLKNVVQQLKETKIKLTASTNELLSPRKKTSVFFAPLNKFFNAIFK